MSRGLSRRGYSIIPLDEELPKNVYGYIAVKSEDLLDYEDEVFSLEFVKRILSQAGSGLRISVDSSKLRNMINKIAGNLKVISKHLSVEMQTIGLRSVAFVVLSDNKPLAASFIADISAGDNSFADASFNDAAAMQYDDILFMVSDSELDDDIVNKSIGYIHRFSEKYATQMGEAANEILKVVRGWKPSVKYIRVTPKNDLILKVRVREDFGGKPITIMLPLSKPSWSLNDLPAQLMDDLRALVIEPLKNSASYAPRGALIVGPPGVGKSVTAEAIAQALELYVLRFSPSLYRSMWYGMTEKTLYTIFRALNRRKDLLVVVDDADFLMNRIAAVHEAYISEVSVWLNILQDPSRPFLVMTSNAPDLIDPAIIRPGRLDIVMVIGYPDKEMRKKIVLRQVSRYGIRISESVMEEISAVTRWFSAAELDSFVRIAASKGHGEIGLNEVYWARRRFNINESERRLIQENLAAYAARIPGIAISYIPKESSI